MGRPKNTIHEVVDFSKNYWDQYYQKEIRKIDNDTLERHRFGLNFDSKFCKFDNTHFLSRGRKWARLRFGSYEKIKIKKKIKEKKGQLLNTMVSNRPSRYPH